MTLKKIIVSVIGIILIAGAGYGLFVGGFSEDLISSKKSDVKKTLSTYDKSLSDYQEGEELTYKESLDVVKFLLKKSSVELSADLVPQLVSKVKERVENDEEHLQAIRDSIKEVLENEAGDLTFEELKESELYDPIVLTALLWVEDKLEEK